MGWCMLEQGSLSKIRNSPLQTLSSTESRSPWRKPHYTLIRKSTGQESAVSHEEEGGTGHNSFTRGGSAAGTDMRKFIDGGPGTLWQWLSSSLLFHDELCS